MTYWFLLLSNLFIAVSNGRDEIKFSFRELEEENISLPI